MAGNLITTIEVCELRLPDIIIKMAINMANKY